MSTSGELSRRRVLAGWALLVAGGALLTAVLTAVRSTSSPSFETMLYFCLAIACALVGGRWPAVAASVCGTLVLNFFFTEPLYTLSIASGANVVTLVVFLLTSMAVAGVVDSAARRRHQAVVAANEAKTLGLLNRSVLGGEYDVPQLLDLARSTFGASAAGLVPVGTDVAATDSAVPAGKGMLLVLRGRVLDDSGRRICAALASYLGVLTDREELARQTEAARELEAGNRTRTALLAAVSHDLRTPLAGIRSSVETLRVHGDRLSAEERTDLLLGLEEATGRLTAMVSDLLDMSRLQTGAVRPSQEEVPLGEVVARALVGLPAAERVAVGSLPAATVDPSLLERVIVNLLANALRHSDVVTVTGDATRGRAIVRIIDHGPGVPEARRDQMFAPFQRLGDTSTGDGVGLGLAVARGLAEAQGGRLTVTDTPGGGLTLLLDLPGGTT